MEVDQYIRSTSKGQSNVTAPEELVEISLMERFHWTPDVIHNLPMKYLQRLFVVMSQRDASAEQSMEARRIEAERRQKAKGQRG